MQNKFSSNRFSIKVPEVELTFGPKDELTVLLWINASAWQLSVTTIPLADER